MREGSLTLRDGEKKIKRDGILTEENGSKTIKKNIQNTTLNGARIILKKEGYILNGIRENIKKKSPIDNESDCLDTRLKLLKHTEVNVNVAEKKTLHSLLSNTSIGMSKSIVGKLAEIFTTTLLQKVSQMRVYASYA